MCLSSKKKSKEKKKFSYGSGNRSQKAHVSNSQVLTVSSLHGMEPQIYISATKAIVHHDDVHVCHTSKYTAFKACNTRKQL